MKPFEILEADISGYLEAIVRSLLMEMAEKRVSDGILRLIGKWINIGAAVDQGRPLISESGPHRGISPLLANVYLHYSGARRR
jgi:hypothetical protein